MRRRDFIAGLGGIAHLINFDEPFGLSVVGALACATPVSAKSIAQPAGRQCPRASHWTAWPIDTFTCIDRSLAEVLLGFHWPSFRCSVAVWSGAPMRSDSITSARLWDQAQTAAKLMLTEARAGAAG
jgi:hypothetical protein